MTELFSNIIEKLSQIDDSETPFKSWTMEERKQLFELYLLISKKESKIFQLIYNFNGSDCYEDIFRDYDREYLNDKIDGVQDALDMINEKYESRPTTPVPSPPTNDISPTVELIPSPIETEIENCINLIQSIKNYTCLYKYIETYNKKYEINQELYDLVTTDYGELTENNKKNLINFINDKYLYNTKINNNKLLSNIFNYDSDTLLKMKINSLFIETRKKEIEHYESLPPEYAEIFKNNNYDNIFDLVKDKLLLQLEKLYEKQAEIYSKK